MNDRIAQNLKTLPSSAGVYIMFDVDKNVLYVGKAKILKNRVRQYFHSSPKPTKVEAMLTHVDSFDYIVCATETDAFTLENTLIKKYKPPFNILLKDDKQYPYEKVDLKSDYPKFIFTRKLVRDKCKYFGPFTVGGKSIDEMLHEVYPLVTCNYKMDELPRSFRPCLNYHINKCCAPCVGKTTKEQYRAICDKAVAFLQGDTQEVKAILTEKMTAEAEKTHYEEAMKYRYWLSLVDKVEQRRTVSVNKLVDFDCFAIVSYGKNEAVNHLMVRSGKVNFSDNTAVADGGIDLAQTLESFLSGYATKVALSKDVYVNVGKDFSAVEEKLSALCGEKVTVSCPKKGSKKALVDMSADNALNFLQRQQTQIDKKYAATVGAVFQLKQLLNLAVLPKRIECYDISNVSGVDKVSSMVVFENGEKAASAYRRFKIRTVEGANDFASMKETLLRRLDELDNPRFGDKPDLIVVDGGLGQLGYAEQALKEKGVDVQLVSLAKREELVYTLNSHEPVALPRNSPAQNMLINVRDEAHRFAITYFRNLHNKNALKSQLLSIEGVGEKRAAALQKKFKNVEEMKNASIEELSLTEGVNSSVAQAVFDFLHKDL